MERGQITIEMILIFGLFILLIFTVSFPTALLGDRNSMEVRVVSDAKFASDRLATFAASISNPSEKREVGIYMPGFTSAGNASNNKSIIWSAVCITSDGRFLNTSIAMIRRTNDGTIVKQETYSFSKNLGRGNWTTYINTGSGYKEGVIVEDRGSRYNISISWENITSNTVPKYLSLNNCSAVSTLGT